MTRRGRSFRMMVRVTTAVLLSAAACKKENKSGCGTGFSEAFSASVGSNLTLPAPFSDCGMKASKTSLRRLIDIVQLDVTLTWQGGVITDSTFYWFWTKNTAYTSGGNLRGDTLQSAGLFTLVRDNFVPEVGQPAISRFQIPLDVYVGWPISGPLERDSLHMRFWTPKSFPDATYGNNYGVYWKWWRVTNGVQNSATVTQPSSPISSGYQASWTLVPPDDTMGYHVKWFWNGNIESSFNDHFTYSKTMPIAGTYTLRVDQILYDTTYTKSYNIVVPVNVTLSGDAIVSSAATNHYSVSASGGTAPYSYSWSIDGTPYTTSTSFDAPYWATYSDHHLEATVTDANGATGYADLWVFVSSCDPQDSNCQSSLRASPQAPKRLPGRTPPPGTRQPTARRP